MLKTPCRYTWMIKKRANIKLKQSHPCTLAAQLPPTDKFCSSLIMKKKRKLNYFKLFNSSYSDISPRPMRARTNSSEGKPRFPKWRGCGRHLIVMPCITTSEFVLSIEISSIDDQWSLIPFNIQLEFHENNNRVKPLPLPFNLRVAHLDFFTYSWKRIYGRTIRRSVSFPRKS